MWLYKDGKKKILTANIYLYIPHNEVLKDFHWDQEQKRHHVPIFIEHCAKGPMVE